MSAYRLADPTSTLCDSHLFVVDYYVNRRLQHYHQHQQVQFKRAVLWIKDEWIAKEMNWRNPSGDSQLEAVFRSQFTMDFLDPAARREMVSSEKKGMKCITIVVNLIFRNRNERPQRYFFPLHYTYLSAPQTTVLAYFNSTTSILCSTASEFLRVFRRLELRVARCSRRSTVTQN